MDIVTYKLGQKYADKVAAGFSSVRVDGLDIIFTLNDGKTATVTVPAPKDGQDGVSITNVSLNQQSHLICTLSDGTAIDAGLVHQGVDGKDGKDGADGAPGQDGKDGQDGVDGQNGNGIISIEKTGTEGLVDTYTIYFTNGTTTTFTVTNGSGGSGTGNYTDLTNKPTINNVELNGNKTSSDLGLQPAGNYVTNTDYATSNVGGVIKVANGDYGLTVDEGALKGTVRTVSQYENMSSKGLVCKGTLENVLEDKGYQEELVSGTNIKTINNVSILGSGNIDIESGSGSNSDWMNSRIDFMGDSITEGYPGGSTVTKKYWEFLGDKLNATVHGYGIGGSTVADGSNPMFSRVLNMERDVDLIFVFGGTNDFANYNRVLGDQFTVSSGTRTLNTNTATFYGGLNQLCLNLITTFPSATYVLLTPIHRKNFSGQKTDLQANGQGLYLDAYVDAIKKVGDWFSIPVIDLYNHSSLYPQDQTQKLTYFASDNDGLHPNTLGHEVLANVIYDELKIVAKKLAGVTYSITKNISNGTAAGATSIAKNGTASVTITANSGYAIPTSITVTGASYNYNNTTGVVTLTNPTNNIVITANCVQVVTYSITGNITNGTKTGATSIIEGRTASITIIPNNGYILPSNITVTNATHTYNDITGVVNLSEPTGDVTVSATCVEAPSYSITTNVTNGSYSGASVIYEGSSAQVAITPNQNYKLPDSVTVVGASQLYSSSTGIITLSNPTGNVTISATCPAIQTYSITNNITHGVASGPSTITENGTATIEITPDTGYYMPDSITVTGASYEYDKANATISLNNPTDNVAITVECTNVAPTVWYMDTTSAEACPNLNSYQTIINTGAFAAGKAATGKTPNPPVGSPINMVRFRAGKNSGTTTGGDGSDVTGTLIVGKFNTSTRKTTEIHEVSLAGLGITANRNIVSEVEIPLMTIEENEIPLYYTANHATFAPYHVSGKDVQMTTLQFKLSTAVGGSAGAEELTWSGNLCIDWGYKG